MTWTRAWQYLCNSNLYSPFCSWIWHHNSSFDSSSRNYNTHCLLIFWRMLYMKCMPVIIYKRSFFSLKFSLRFTFSTDLCVLSLVFQLFYHLLYLSSIIAVSTCNLSTYMTVQDFKFSYSSVSCFLLHNTTLI